jgi:hypothetical protein
LEACKVCFLGEALAVQDIAASAVERFGAPDLADAAAAAAAEEPPLLGLSSSSSSSSSPLLPAFSFVGALLFCFIRFIDALVRVWLVSASFCR